MTPQTNNAQPTRIGVILAGGQSRRMGQDKAMLSHQGVSLLAHMTKLLQEADCQVVVLSGHPRAGFVGKVVPDEMVDAGPVSGIVSSFRYLMSHYPMGTQCLVVPVDMPKLSSKLLNNLVYNAQDADCALFDRYPLPFCLNLTQALKNCLQHPAVLDIRNQRSPSIRAFLSPLKMTLLEPNFEQLEELVNLNTPEEWNNL